MAKTWNIPLYSGDVLPIILDRSSPLFIVGPNGSGKSALIHHAVTSLGPASVKRIAAHRQTWLSSGTIDMTAMSRKRFDKNLRSYETNPNYRWSEWDPAGRLSSVLFDLTAKENDLARRIMENAYARNQGEVDTIVDNERPVFNQINDLLELAGFAVTIEKRRWRGNKSEASRCRRAV